MALSDRTKPRTELLKGQRAAYAKQFTAAQLLFHARLDPLKLARHPLKVVAGSPRDPFQMLTNGSPGGFNRDKKTAMLHSVHCSLQDAVTDWLPSDSCC